jgi:hypothetical protein
MLQIVGEMLFILRSFFWSVMCCVLSTSTLFCLRSLFKFHAQPVEAAISAYFTCATRNARVIMNDKQLLESLSATLRNGNRDKCTQNWIIEEFLRDFDTFRESGLDRRSVMLTVAYIHVHMQNTTCS